MKNLKTFLITFFVIGITCLFFSCEEDKIEGNNTKLLDINDFKKLGELHNKFLKNASDNFIIDPNISSKKEAINAIKAFNIEYANDLDFFKNSKINHKEFFESTKSFVVAEDFETYLFKNNNKLNDLLDVQGKSKFEKYFKVSSVGSKNTDVNPNFGAYHEILIEAKSNSIIDDFEFNELKKLGNILEDNFKGKISNNEVELYLTSMEDRWKEKQYTTDSENGRVMIQSVEIGKASLEFWEDENNPARKLLNRPIPVVVANDIAGAVIGGAIGGAKSKSWKGAGEGALIGAVVASTGVVGRFGKWISKLF